MAEWLVRDQGKNRSLAATKRLLNADVLPHRRHRRIDEIGRRDVLDVIDRVIDRGSPVMARQLHVVLHRLFRWSVGRGIIEVNPLTDMDLPESNPPRKRFLTDSELADCHARGWRAWRLWRRRPVARSHRVQASRDCRAHLGQIDGDMIKLDGKRRKNGEPMMVKLSAPAKAIIDGMPRTGAFVFFGVQARRKLVQAEGSARCQGGRACRRFVAALEFARFEKDHCRGPAKARHWFAGGREGPGS